MKTEKLLIKDIIPYKKNAKKHDKVQIANVAKSLQEYGLLQPLIVDKDNVLVVGHCRLLAAKKLKWKEVDCVRAEHLTEEQIAKYRLLDNKLNESDWDFELLAEEVGDLDFDGYDIDWGIEEPEKKEIVEDDPPEPDLTSEPVAQYGDIWQLGSHRLMCGDSTKPEDVAKLCNGQQMDLFLTDPPYNVDYVGKTKDALKIQNDKMGDDSFRLFLQDAFLAADTVMKKGCVFYIWHAGTEGYNFIGGVRGAGWLLKELIIWVKNVMVMGRQDYQWLHEPCLYGWKPGAGHYFSGGRKQKTVIESVDLMNEDELRQAVRDLTESEPVNVLREKKPTKSDLHPTMKPVRLFARLIENSSRVYENVLDLFGGSGATIMACEQLNRSAYVMELDPRYVDVIIKRWEDFTGEQAVKIKEEIKNEFF